MSSPSKQHSRSHGLLRSTLNKNAITSQSGQKSKPPPPDRQSGSFTRRKGHALAAFHSFASKAVTPRSTVNAYIGSQDTNSFVQIVNPKDAFNDTTVVKDSTLNDTKKTRRGRQPLKSRENTLTTQSIGLESTDFSSEDENVSMAKKALRRRTSGKVLLDNRSLFNSVLPSQEDQDQSSQVSIDSPGEKIQRKNLRQRSLRRSQVGREDKDDYSGIPLSQESDDSATRSINKRKSLKRKAEFPDAEAETDEYSGIPLSQESDQSATRSVSKRKSLGRRTEFATEEAEKDDFSGIPLSQESDHSTTRSLTKRRQSLKRTSEVVNDGTEKDDFSGIPLSQESDHSTTRRQSLKRNSEVANDGTEKDDFSGIPLSQESNQSATRSLTKRIPLKRKAVVPNNEADDEAYEGIKRKDSERTADIDKGSTAADQSVKVSSARNRERPEDVETVSRTERNSSDKKSSEPTDQLSVPSNDTSSIVRKSGRHRSNAFEIGAPSSGNVLDLPDSNGKGAEDEEEEEEREKEDEEKESEEMKDEITFHPNLESTRIGALMGTPRSTIGNRFTSTPANRGRAGLQPLITPRVQNTLMSEMSPMSGISRVTRRTLAKMCETGVQVTPSLAIGRMDQSPGARSQYARSIGAASSIGVQTTPGLAPEHVQVQTSPQKSIEQTWDWTAAQKTLTRSEMTRRKSSFGARKTVLENVEAMVPEASDYIDDEIALSRRPERRSSRLSLSVRPEGPFSTSVADEVGLEQRSVNASQAAQTSKSVVEAEEPSSGSTGMSPRPETSSVRLSASQSVQASRSLVQPAEGLSTPSIADEAGLVDRSVTRSARSLASQSAQVSSISVEASGSVTVLEAAGPSTSVADVTKVSQRKEDTRRSSQSVQASESSSIEAVASGPSSTSVAPDASVADASEEASNHRNSTVEQPEEDVSEHSSTAVALDVTVMSVEAATDVTAEQAQDDSAAVVEPLVTETIVPEALESIDNGLSEGPQSEGQNDYSEFVVPERKFRYLKEATPKEISEIRKYVEETESAAGTSQQTSSFEFKKPRTPKRKEISYKVKRTKKSEREVAELDVYQRFSSHCQSRIPRNAAPLLKDILDCFMSKARRMIDRRARQHGRESFEPCDIKAVMQRVGLIPEEDPHHRHLYAAIRDVLPDGKDREMVIPMAKWNGVPGATTIPDDFWDEKTERKRKKKKRREEE